MVVMEGWNEKVMLKQRPEERKQSSWQKRKGVNAYSSMMCLACLGKSEETIWAVAKRMRTTVLGGIE